MREALRSILRDIATPAVAVSGGVDSVTLAALACLEADAEMFHATSAAVPAEATDRVRRLAAEHGWRLTIVQAGEFEDPAYVSNPVNRCFHCKTHLYSTIRAHTARTILSGANLDDLAEYRPGLDAARDHAVRHPFIEAGMNKLAVRHLARDLGLAEVAELPSSPCLSSRVETGIRIRPRDLMFVHRVERAVTLRLRPLTVRCRIRAQAIVVELDQQTLAAVSPPLLSELTALVRAQRGLPAGLGVAFEPYRNGSAFVHEQSA